MKVETNKLYGAKGALEALFDPESRPSIRWLREKERTKQIPSVRIGRLVFFDLEQVRKAIL